MLKMDLRSVIIAGLFVIGALEIDGNCISKKKQSNAKKMFFFSKKNFIQFDSYKNHFLFTIIRFESFFERRPNNVISKGHWLEQWALANARRRLRIFKSANHTHYWWIRS